MNWWFIGDTHFNHKNIIKYCSRPFDSIEEHDRQLIENWNDRVSQNDWVFHLGDVAMNPTHAVDNVLPYLKGRKILIIGNHDKKLGRYRNHFYEIANYKELKTSDKQTLVLFHYPILDWNKKFHGSWHLYGHIHSDGVAYHSQSLDVGVDSVSKVFGQDRPEDYRPVNLEEITQILPRSIRGKHE